MEQEDFSNKQSMDLGVDILNYLKHIEEEQRGRGASKVSKIATMFQFPSENDDRDEKDGSGPHVTVVRTESHVARFNTARALFEKMAEKRGDDPESAKGSNQRKQSGQLGGIPIFRGTPSPSSGKGSSRSPSPASPHSIVQPNGHASYPFKHNSSNSSSISTIAALSYTSTPSTFHSSIQNPSIPSVLPLSSRSTLDSEVAKSRWHHSVTEVPKSNLDSNLKNKNEMSKTQASKETTLISKEDNCNANKPFLNNGLVKKVDVGSNEILNQKYDAPINKKMEPRCRPNSLVKPDKPAKPETLIDKPLSSHLQNQQIIQRHKNWFQSYSKTKSPITSPLKYPQPLSPTSSNAAILEHRKQFEDTPAIHDWRKERAAILMGSGRGSRQESEEENVKGSKDISKLKNFEDVSTLPSVWSPPKQYNELAISKPDKSYSSKESDTSSSSSESSSSNSSASVIRAAGIGHGQGDSSLGEKDGLDARSYIITDIPKESINVNREKKNLTTDGHGIKSKEDIAGVFKKGTENVTSKDKSSRHLEQDYSNQDQMISNYHHDVQEVNTVRETVVMRHREDLPQDKEQRLKDWEKRLSQRESFTHAYQGGKDERNLENDILCKSSVAERSKYGNVPSEHKQFRVDGAPETNEKCEDDASENTQKAKIIELRRKRDKPTDKDETTKSRHKDTDLRRNLREDNLTMTNNEEGKQEDSERKRNEMEFEKIARIEKLENERKKREELEKRKILIEERDRLRREEEQREIVKREKERDKLKREEERLKIEEERESIRKKEMEKLRKEEEEKERKRREDEEEREKLRREEEEREKLRIEEEEREKRKRKEEEQERLRKEEEEREYLRKKELRERLRKEEEERERIKREEEELERLRIEAEERERLKIEDEEREKQRRDEQQRERLRREEQHRDRMRREEQERLRREEEERERLRREEEERERLRREEEERERLRREEEERERLRREEEEQERLRREEEEQERLKREKEEQERLRREEEEQENLRREEEERKRLRKEEEKQERLRREEEERERQKREAEERERLRREEKERERLRREEEERERLRIEEEQLLEKLRIEEEERERLKIEEEQERLRREEEERERLRKEEEEKEKLRREKKEIERLMREEEKERERQRIEEEEKERLRREVVERERVRKMRRDEEEREKLKREEEEQKRLRRREEEEKERILREKLEREEQRKRMRAEELERMMKHEGNSRVTRELEVGERQIRVKREKIFNETKRTDNVLASKRKEMETKRTEKEATNHNYEKQVEEQLDASHLKELEEMKKVQHGERDRKEELERRWRAKREKLEEEERLRREKDRLEIEKTKRRIAELKKERDEIQRQQAIRLRMLINEEEGGGNKDANTEESDCSVSKDLEEPQQTNQHVEGIFKATVLDHENREVQTDITIHSGKNDRGTFSIQSQPPVTVKNEVPQTSKDNSNEKDGMDSTDPACVDAPYSRSWKRDAAEREREQGYEEAPSDEVVYDHTVISAQHKIQFCTGPYNEPIAKGLEEEEKKEPPHYDHFSSSTLSSEFEPLPPPVPPHNVDPAILAARVSVDQTPLPPLPVNEVHHEEESEMPEPMTQEEAEKLLSHNIMETKKGMMADSGELESESRTILTDVDDQDDIDTFRKAEEQEEDRDAFDKDYDSVCVDSPTPDHEDEEPLSFLKHELSEEGFVVRAKEVHSEDGVHYLEDGHFWIQIPALMDDDDDELPESVPVHKHTKLKFSKEPIKLFSTFSVTDYDRRNDDVDPVAASAEYELEKRVEKMNVFPVCIEKGEGGLGLSIIGMGVGADAGVEKLGIFVKTITPGGATDNDGRIKVNDQIIEVDNQSLVGVTQMFAASVLKNTSGTVNFMIGRENDPENSEVAMLIRQSLLADQERDERRRALEGPNYDPRNSEGIFESFSSQSGGESPSEEAARGGFPQGDNQRDHNVYGQEFGDQYGDPYGSCPSTPPEGVSSPPPEAFNHDVEGRDILLQNNEIIIMSQHLQEIQHRNDMYEEEISILRNKISDLEKELASTNELTKRFHETNTRLKDAEDKLQSRQAEIATYQDMLEQSQGQYIILEKKYYKAKKIIKEYQSRERDFLHREEYHITQLEEKDALYNSLVKALKDRVIQLEGDLIKAQQEAGLPVNVPPDLNSQSSNFVQSKSQDNHSSLQRIPSKEELDVAVPPTELLDNSFSKAKGELASRGGLANRQLPSLKKTASNASTNSIDHSFDDIVDDSLPESQQLPQVTTSPVVLTKTITSSSSTHQEESVIHISSATTTTTTTTTTSNTASSHSSSQGSSYNSRPTPPPPYQATHPQSPTHPPSPHHQPPPYQPPPSAPLSYRPVVSPDTHSGRNEAPYRHPPPIARVQPVNRVEALPHTSPHSQNSLHHQQTLAHQLKALLAEREGNAELMHESNKDPSPLKKSPSSLMEDVRRAVIQADMSIGKKPVISGPIHVSSTAQVVSTGQFVHSRTSPQKGSGVSAALQQKINRDSGTWSPKLNAGITSASPSGGVVLLSQRPIDSSLPLAQANENACGLENKPTLGSSDSTSSFDSQYQDKMLPGKPPREIISVFDWTKEQVAQWLVVQGLENYVSTFISAGITGPRLINIDTKDLKNLGLSTEDKNKIKRKVKELRQNLEKERKQIEKENKEREKLQKKAEKLAEKAERRRK